MKSSEFWKVYTGFAICPPWASQQQDYHPFEAFLTKRLLLKISKLSFFRGTRRFPSTVLRERHTKPSSKGCSNVGAPYLGAEMEVEVYQNANLCYPPKTTSWMI